MLSGIRKVSLLRILTYLLCSAYYEILGSWLENKFILEEWWMIFSKVGKSVANLKISYLFYIADHTCSMMTDSQL